MSSHGVDPEIWQSTWRGWWSSLKLDRHSRAELRRCGTVLEAAFCSAFHRLREMQGRPDGDLDLRKLGLIAAVLSHVEVDDPQAGSLAKQMATAQGDKPLVSDARFRQLIRLDDAECDARLKPMVRILRQLGGRASVDRLAKALFWWNEKTKRDWALDYYATAPQPAG